MASGKRRVRGGKFRITVQNDIRLVNNPVASSGLVSDVEDNHISTCYIDSPTEGYWYFMTCVFKDNKKLLYSQSQ
ncbi:MAG: hypothetical protein B1H11_07540 [Desulfobacteraceae bacterium 4484_190.1]|nr:MAG: hypothetical protein B1H11_07540 [Desulfobacteraceae bacterium 4484_190.1]